ncbi:diadenylate cyclase CdaA [Enterococcus hirae]|nr:diadenylate cyclase CdaA [Enterococcus hirae]
MNLSKLFDWQYLQQFITHDFFSYHFFINILDIMVVWILVYRLIILVRGTKAVQLLKGVAFFFVLRTISGLIGLNTLTWLMDQIINYGVIAAIVIFQPEIRRGLEHLGRSPIFTMSRLDKRNQEEKLIKAYDKAIQYMSKRKIGALVTIERQTGLDEYIETGIPLDADISGELLINIFIPNTPLHDGAVIIKDDKIAVASAYLPLTESTKVSKEFGTRHRAAIGISEVSDALTIVVSEETGGVSITLNNEFIPHLSQAEYIKILTEELGIPKENEKKNTLQQFIDEVTRGSKK